MKFAPSVAQTSTKQHRVPSGRLGPRAHNGRPQTIDSDRLDRPKGAVVLENATTFKARIRHIQHSR